MDTDVQTLLSLGTDATPHQIARLLEKHKDVNRVAAALLDGNFEDDDVRGRQVTKAIAPALPPRRKQNSPVDDSRALIRREDASNMVVRPTYDEDEDFKKAVAMSLADDQPPPLEPLPVYGPLPFGAQTLDEPTDHALRQALEASLNDGKNSLAADVYIELGLDEQIKPLDGRPTAFRSSDPKSIFVPPVLQALFAIPEVLNRFKTSSIQPPIELVDGEALEPDLMKQLDRAWHDCETTRELFAHADITQRAYVDVQPWAERGGWSQENMSDTPATAALDFLHRLTRALNLSLANNQESLFLSRFHSPNSPTRPSSTPIPPHVEISHLEDLTHVVPLRPYATDPAPNLISVLEAHIAADGIGFVSLPAALAFRIEGGKKIEFPTRLWMDRWTIDKREFVEHIVLKRQGEIEKMMREIELEKERLVRHEGRDTIKDLGVCIRHFETTASDGGDEKRRERNERTLGKLKAILKNIEDRCEEIIKKSEEITAEAAGLWTQPELMNIPYDLRAVLIHDGLLGRTHLYSYVKRADKWWKVVDANVSEVTEDVVLGDSAGVHLGAGVVGLVYSRPGREEAGWGRKERTASRELDTPFLAQLSSEIQARQQRSEPMSEDEEEFMDAEEMIVVAPTPDVPEDVSMEELSPPAGVV